MDRVGGGEKQLEDCTVGNALGTCFFFSAVSALAVIPVFVVKLVISMSWNSNIVFPGQEGVWFLYLIKIDNYIYYIVYSKDEKDDVNLLVHNNSIYFFTTNYIYFITYNATTNDLLSNGGLYSTLYYMMNEILFTCLSEYDGRTALNIGNKIYSTATTTVYMFLHAELVLRCLPPCLANRTENA
ncbi:hypothetical protein ACJX0J_013904, partial [Zea mays]